MAGKAGVMLRVSGVSQPGHTSGRASGTVCEETEGVEARDSQGTE